MTVALEPRTTARPLPTCKVALPAAGLVVVLVTIALVWGTAWRLLSATAAGTSWHLFYLVVGLLAAVGVLALLRPALHSLAERGRAGTALGSQDLQAARIHRSRCYTSAWVAMGWSAAAVLVVAVVSFLLANDHAVQKTFLSPEMLSQSWWETTKAFRTNVFIAVVAEVIVLVWGLLLAVARSAPGRAGRPVAFLARIYIDAFRAVPGIIVIYLIGFGLPLAGVPVLSSMSPTWSAIFALTLTYGAYVAEVYRSGIESIHPSQNAAARSLGLSHGQTLRSVIVPQAVRRVVPPLLNDFIGLQKDTALVMVIGTVDAFTQAKIYASNYFNLSSVTVVALLFVLITIPQTRFVDRLIERDQRRQGR
ncbi:amino acid ABC transporter permease [Nocardioides sp. GY 10127]|uniref:amino acid ABC transporter permease n=1 Tax=Nocardioides sp. GY 10127 TaxID=2569762 RepID=UPI0010A93EEF|nr:amino acid ABC transporter permease [Nocardioides sp. GY 10127]TIC80061.1 amino acid ABC transporter permease [Nocardioides sp. GY 10127]